MAIDYPSGQNGADIIRRLNEAEGVPFAMRRLGAVAPMRQSPARPTLEPGDSDFKKWATAMGFTGREVGKAGEAIGIGMTSAREHYRGETEVSLTERLAMAAVAAGLPAWTPGFDRKRHSPRHAVRLARRAG